MMNEILNAIKEKLKSLEYELRIWDDEFEGGGQLAKRELMGKVEAYRDILGMMGSLRSDAGELGSDGFVCPKNFAAWCQENYSIEIPERVVSEYERYNNAVGKSEQSPCDHEADTAEKTLRCVCCEECGEIIEVLD